MGKARILSGGTDGLYQIEIIEDRTRAEAARTTALQRVAQLDARITDLEVGLSDAQSAVDAAVADQDQAIADYQAALHDDGIDTAAARQAMTAAGEALLQAAAQRDAIRGHIRAAKAERLTLQARIERIDALPPLRQVDAWCADYVEDLSGEVATAEVPGEIGQVIIQPGFDDGAAWSPSEDGAIQPALSGTPASVFYNLAMMPGWQRWRPTFRIATISNINNDLCDIALDSATSSQQGLNVNAQSSYSGVPIMYMDCNGDAFEDGDRVLVAFSGNTDQPMVVGFEQEPKECVVGFDTTLFRYWRNLKTAFTDAGVYSQCTYFVMNKSIRVSNIYGRGASVQQFPEDNYVMVALFRCQGVIPQELMLYGTANDALSIEDGIISYAGEEGLVLEKEKTYMIMTLPSTTADYVPSRVGFDEGFFMDQKSGVVAEIITPPSGPGYIYTYGRVVNAGDIGEDIVFNAVGSAPSEYRNNFLGPEEDDPPGRYMNLFGINYSHREDILL